MAEPEQPSPQSRPVPGPALVALSNAMVALHREQFGRGPAAARAFLVERMAICVLHDPYTRVERTLIEAGKGEHVRATRLAHQRALADRYKAEAEAALGRAALAHLSAVEIGPDLAIEVFLLGEGLGALEARAEAEDVG
jgi:uncharacterized protein YbcI